MSTRHVIHQIEAYLDGQLPSKDRYVVEEHVAICPACARHLLEARRVAAELGPTMQATLGRPHPPSGLRHRIRQEISGANPSRQFSLP